MSAMKRKKALAARLICSYRKRGRKVNTPYLVVLQQKTKRREDLFFFTFRQMERHMQVTKKDENMQTQCANNFFNLTD